MIPCTGGFLLVQGLSASVSMQDGFRLRHPEAQATPCCISSCRSRSITSMYSVPMRYCAIIALLRLGRRYRHLRLRTCLASELLLIILRTAT